MDNNKTPHHLVNPLPQPLPLHLTLAMMSYSGSSAYAAYQNLKSGSGNLSVPEVESAARKKLLNFIEGVGEYSRAKIDAWKPDAKILWQEGSTRILDFGGKGDDLVIIPPLINRANILDFGDNSFVKYLKDAGYRPLLVDWQDPGVDEKDFDSDDYTERLARFTSSLKKKPVVIGYCMGGVFALKLAEKIKPKALVLLATPWKFKNTLTAPKQYFESYIDSMEFVPPEFISSLFASADLFAVYDKFSAIKDMDSRRKKEFFAVEYWVNNGVAMTAPLARECIIDWVFDNKLGIDASNIKCKTLVVCATQDKIVPLDSSLPLVGVIDNAELMKFNSGHIGIITKKLVHEPLVTWLNKL